MTTTPILELTPRARIVAIVGASSGNLVEWFDFYVYSFCALYFSSAFFPSGNPTTQLLNTAGIFAVGFLMRPVGGWLFGRIADRLGRRRSMMISVLMMCGGSLMIAVMPTYATIGTAAGAAAGGAAVPGPVRGRRVRHQRNLYERGIGRRPPRLLWLLPVRDADRRPAVGAAGAVPLAAVADAG